MSERRIGGGNVVGLRLIGYRDQVQDLLKLLAQLGFDISHTDIRPTEYGGSDVRAYATVFPRSVAPTRWLPPLDGE